MYHRRTNASNLIIAPRLGQMQIPIFFHCLQFHYHTGETGHLVEVNWYICGETGISALLEGFGNSLRWRCWWIFLLMLFISGRLTAAASEIPSILPVIICWGASREVSALLLMLAFAFTTSTFVCVGGCVWSFTSCKNSLFLANFTLALHWPLLLISHSHDVYFVCQVLVVHIHVSVLNKFSCTFFASYKFHLNLYIYVLFTAIKRCLTTE